MAAPTRFPGGVTNVAPSHPLAYFGLPDPAKWHVYFNDFDTFSAADWTITTTEDGAGSASEALADGDGGLLLITNDAADDDADFFQKVGESFRFAAGKPVIFRARFKVSDATQSDVIMGLAITDTTPLDASDGVFFLKADGVATIGLSAVKDSTATTAAAIATLADNTFITLAFWYDGKATITYFVDDVEAGSIVADNVPDDEDVTITFGIQNGEAAAKTMTVDYIFAAKAR
ncbi:hypothetical protein L2U69_11840 [Zavarzinia compransoris]|uniref:hypothetical protein n=1 Tax=Zavarzinia marina TaxID=2911065 RepID=UPI001F3A8C8D|nr:hypothetical protein [Zavarzinia marina]MCF4166338.1 hypothetical protein [Zavarzinia marina]